MSSPRSFASLILAPLALALTFGSGAFATARAADHALIITVNRAPPGRPDRHYADDDGAKWSELFEALYGPGHATLLTRFDPATRALHPALAARAGRPTLAAVNAAFAGLGATLGAEPQGERVATIVLAGHGGWDGEGFFALEGTKLTATMLAKLLIELPADRIHLVIDAKNARSLVRPDPRLGVVLASTSATAVWESNELESDVFAHVFRSALRGAADADRDRRISYRELGAFIADAIAELPEGPRPNVFVAAAAGDDTWARLDRTDLRTVALELPVARRVTVRDERGARLLDGNFLPGPPLGLVLPHGLLVIEEHGLVDGVETTRTGFVAEGATTIGTLPADASSEHVADPVPGLFTGGFGPPVVAAYEPRSELVIEGGDAVSRVTAQRFGDVLLAGANLEERARVLGGVSLLGLGTFTTVVGLTLIDDGDDDSEAIGGVLVGTGAVSLIVGAITLLFPAELERMHEAFAKVPLDDEAARSAAVRRFELRFADEARDYGTTRVITAGTTLALGIVSIVGGALVAGEEGELSSESGFLLGTGVLLTGLGTYNLTTRHEIEEVWDLYQRLKSRGGL